MNIFVSGGCGFIGTHLIKKLNQVGHSVTIFDNFSNSSKTENIKKQKKNLQIIEGDIRNFEELSKSIIGHDLVIHLAAKISVTESLKNPNETYEVNVKGTENILKACKKNSIKKIIALSSAAVYGNNDNPNHKFRENDKTIPISPYGISKIKMEESIQKSSKTDKNNSIVLRLFNVYGKGQTDEYAGVISKFIDKIKNNESLIIFGEGNQTRDFIYIDDLVELITNIINQNFKKKFEVYNIGNGKPCKIIDLANLMIKISPSKNKIIFKEKREGEIVHSIAAIDKAKKELNFNPKISLEVGIKKLLLL
ncbi:MAG: NAD-dependent epimerase/dehydratase family protein [Nitrosopumilus sp.]|nr:NAD-dependent epimerase/dehydratase family protein [Nitrosopumilus sp.]